jgi:murein DD-endopeptidase MepM/ murein hydrolase activator NlpD
MPQIDINMRKLGIGGEKLETSRFLNGMAPIINKELAVLEMDIEKLSREVNFEMKSYKSIYDEVQKNIQRIVRIPSIKPVDGGFLNSTFGYRNDPIDNVKRFHHGQDITVKSGTPIYSPADGEIKRAYYVGGFGNHIKIDHGLGYTTLFAHLSKLKVKHGQKVKRGEVIGLTGNTGRSTAPHLHYEIHYNGEPQNPLDYFFSDNSN